MILLKQMGVPKLLKCTAGTCVIVFVYMFFLHVLPVKSQGSVPTVVLQPKPAVEQKRLRSDLLINYDRYLRPVKNQTQFSTVGVFYDVHHITSLDEKSQILSVRGQLMLFWTDEFLKWDPKSYSTINKVRFASDEIWWPDLYAEYNVKLLTLGQKNLNPPITVYSNGSAEWFPHVQFDVPCSANYRHYPFDSHDCSVILSAYGYNASGVLMEPRRPYWKEQKLPQGTEWAVTKISQDAQVAREFRSHPITYQAVNVKIFLERISRIYRYLCVIPTLISMVTLLFGFWLLPSETSRYLIGCGNIIVLSMLLQHLAVAIPAGRNTPLIAQYSASCLSLSAVFVILTVIVNLLRECNGSAPSVLVRFAHFSVDRYLCIFTFSHVTSQDLVIPDAYSRGEPSTNALSPDELKRRKDWYAVSILVDRIAFWSFAFTVVILLTVLASV